ncbi:MAG: hypothetical protein HWE25_08555 [Alphaproteobacteria bacterium]|nr:hypothetical protein [Alphaproteobacteria bacterium]
MRIFLAILVLGLAACGVREEYPKVSASGVDTLGSINLQPEDGSCIWIFSLRTESADQTPVFGFSGRTGYLAINGERQHLALEKASDNMVMGVSHQQSFRSDELVATLVLREATDAPARTLDGVLSLTKPSGWSTVLPLRGTEICR